jgi:hypothetical protein
LTSLNLSTNSLGPGPETWNKDQGKYYVASTSSFITKEEAFSGVAALAGAIRDMGGLSVANVMGNNIGKEMLSMLQDIMHSKPNLVSLCGIADDATEADLSGLNMDADDAIILASELPDKGAISSVNLLKNRIPVEQAQELVKIMQSKEKLVTLCGLGKDKTELDFSGQNLDAGDAVLIANDISDMRALTSLNLAKNYLGSNRGKAKYSNSDPDIDEHWEWHTDMSGIVAIFDVIGDMRALTSLNLSSNNLKAEGEKIVAEAIKVPNNAMGLFRYHFNAHLITG